MKIISSHHIPFALETLVDYPDDALSHPFPLTARHLDAMMARFAACGLQRVLWAYYGDGHGGMLIPAGIENCPGERPLAFDQNHWAAYARTVAVLGNPLQAAVEAAHRHGLELYAYFKPYETGVSLVLPEGSPAARIWGRLKHGGGYLSWLDPFVLENPHLRVQRRSDDLAPDMEHAVITTLRLTKQDAAPTRIRHHNLQIWVSNLNYSYRRCAAPFNFAESIEPSPHEVRDMYGNLLTRQGDSVRVLTLSGLELTDPYVMVTTDFAEGAGDFANAWHRLLTAFDANGREIPGIYATGTAIWFPERESFWQGGLCFDTGRGPELITLDEPNELRGKNAPMEMEAVDSPPRSTRASDQHALEGVHRVSGCIAYQRGRNSFLPGALCESEPQVQRFWLRCIQEMLDANVDGVELRVENHSSHTDTPEDYGFNPVVLDQVDTRSNDLLHDIARVRGAAYSRFLSDAKKLVRSQGKKMRVNLNLDWFRPAEERPGSRRLAFPANVEWQWQSWIQDGLADAVVLRPFATPFDAVFGGDAVAEEMIELCRRHRVPITVNRYVFANPRVPDELERVQLDGRFAGFILYEAWSFLRFTAAGGCEFAADDNRPEGYETAIWDDKVRTALAVQAALDGMEHRRTFY